MITTTGNVKREQPGHHIKLLPHLHATMSTAVSRHRLERRTEVGVGVKSINDHNKLMTVLLTGYNVEHS